LVYRKNFDIVICQRDKVDESQRIKHPWLLCVSMCGCGHMGYLGMPLIRGAIFVGYQNVAWKFWQSLITRKVKVVVLNGEYGSVKFNI